jgi:prepilin-type N-terminal cleavage/methylation domain-containing protein
MRRPAFTLTECLVSLTVIGILASLLVVGVQHVQNAAAIAACQSNLRQIGLALHNYHSIYNRFPAQPGIQRDSWMFQVLPHLEQNDLYQTAWTPSCNSVWQVTITTLLCPSSAWHSQGSYPWMGVEYAMTDYLGVAGSDSSLIDAQIWDGVLGNPGRAVRASDITRGLSSVLMAGERPPGPDQFWGWWGYREWDNALWAIGDTLTAPVVTIDNTAAGEPCPKKNLFSAGDLTNYCHVNHFWSLHGCGGNWLFGDGSVHFLNYSAGDSLVPQMANIASDDASQN